MSNLLLQPLAPANIYEPPSLLDTLLTQPLKTLIRLLDLLLSLFHTSPQIASSPLRIVCISDTHCLTTSHIPDGDLLIHAGDLTDIGNPAELQDQIDWLAALPHEHKIAIAGNHDRFLDPRSRKTLSFADQDDGFVNWKSIWYLQHSAVDLTFKSGRKLRVYGAPQTPADGQDDHAFRYARGSDAWSGTVPSDVDVLVTHAPPKYHLDLPAALGCEHLLAEVWRVRPRLHVFGHVHAGKTDYVGRLKGGREVVRWDERQRCVEQARARSDGLVRGIVDPRGWVDVVKVLGYGGANLLWDRVWGGRSEESTTMVLASLMYCNSGELLNPPQVVEM